MSRSLTILSLCHQVVARKATQIRTVDSFTSRSFRLLVSVHVRTPLRFTTALKRAGRNLAFVVSALVLAGCASTRGSTQGASTAPSARTSGPVNVAVVYLANYAGGASRVARISYTNASGALVTIRSRLPWRSAVSWFRPGTTLRLVVYAPVLRLYSLQCIIETNEGPYGRAIQGGTLQKKLPPEACGTQYTIGQEPFP